VTALAGEAYPVTRRVVALPPGQSATVEVTRCPAPDALRAEWLSLEAQARPSFFTSWAWIGCWLGRFGAQSRPQLFRVRRSGQTLALGLFVKRKLMRLRCLPSHGWLLHATGERNLDDVTTEHNALLVRADLTAADEGALLTALFTQCSDLDQIVVPSASRVPHWSTCTTGPGLLLRTHDEQAYRVDLGPVRAAGLDYVSSLGATTRATIRRSQRLYAQLGPLRLEVAADIGEALAWLEALKALHQAHWVGRGLPGVFGNPAFETFHRALIENGFADGGIHLMRLKAGEQDVGYLYNFVHGGQMLSYQSGVRFDLLTGNHHPGLLIHALAVQHALDQGLQAYDFMAGESRYKRQLANSLYPMTSYSLHRDTAALRLEETWRALKRRWLQPVPAIAGLDGALAAGRSTRASGR
jgi:CelD/BcsL family acetyltransferase involved in cellulose biosynthesis